MAFAFWTSTFFNPDASLIDGFSITPAIAENRISFGNVWFQKEEIGSEVFFLTAQEHSFGPLQPTYAVSTTMKNGVWAGVGFSNTLRLSDAYQVNLRFLPGVYSRGKDVDLGGWIMFRSEIGLEYHISDNWGVSVSFDHRSSGDIWPYNPGMETIQLSISKKIK